MSIEALRGRSDKRIAISVSIGLYQSINAIAPMNVRMLSSIRKVFVRYPFSITGMSFVSAEMYTEEFSPENAEMFFLDISEKTYSLYCEIPRVMKRGLVLYTIR